MYALSVDLSVLDSSQNDTLSDQDDHRPGFASRISYDDQDTGATQTSSSFSMYNSVSQKLMVMCLWHFSLSVFALYSLSFLDYK